MLSVFSHPVPSGPASPVKPAGAVTSGISLRALLIAELSDLYHAKQQLLKARPRMAKAATNLVLRAGLADQVKQTQRQMTRLVQAFGLLGLPARGRPCHAMKGLIEETVAAIALEGPAAVRDAALIGAAQRVEHYEIAGYGTARSLATRLGLADAASLLQLTLDEERETDEKLTELARSMVNEAAAAPDKEGE